MQRGQPLGTEGAVRDALDGSAGTDAVQPQFVPLPGELAPGEAMPVRLAVLLRGRPDSSLALSATGVLRAAGQRERGAGDGARARLAAVRMLLPVLSLPPDPTSAATPARRHRADASGLPCSTRSRTPTAAVHGARRADPAHRRRAGHVTGAGRPAGRPGRRAGPPRWVRRCAPPPAWPSIRTWWRPRWRCASGYQVVGPGGARCPGAGAEVAGRWVDALVAAARGGCVLALPFADADLVALNRGGLGQLAVTAQTEGRQLLTDLLGTPVVGQVGWPADGLVDERDAGPDVGRRQPRGAAVRGRHRAGPHPAARGGAAARRPAGSAVRRAHRPAAERGRDRTAPAEPGRRRRRWRRRGQHGGRHQHAAVDPGRIGALAFRARSGPDRSGAPVVLAPPHQWAAEAAGATALLQAVDTLMEAGFLTPRPLGDVLAAGPAATARPGR